MLTVIKIGGNIIDDAEKLSAFLGNFSLLSGAKILVHGGGKLATDFGKRLNIEPNYVEGRRVTDEATLELVTMVYGGLINKNIVAQLQATGCNAIGLTGADGNLIKAVKRPVKTVDYGFVGDVTAEGVNVKLITQLLAAGLVPVVAPLTHDAAGTMLNTNADTIAQELAKAMAKVMDVQLVYCFEKDGVLDKDGNVIPTITGNDIEQLKQNGTISDGMIPKLQNASAAVSAGVRKVVIGNNAFLSELISGNTGTQII